MQTSCCYAVQDKTWVADPDGNEWEAFVVLEDNLPVTTMCCTPQAEAQTRELPHATAAAADAATQTTTQETASEVSSCCTTAEAVAAEVSSCCATAAPMTISR
jgi:hypothetical protein